MLDGLPCRNHREHSRIAKSVLKRCREMLGLIFLRVWIVLAQCFGFGRVVRTKANRGFELIKGES
jgi:hypothetical protein